MKDIKTNVVTKSLDLTARGAVTGEIYFEVDGDYFPELHWNDFVISILNWWIEAIEKIISSSIGMTTEFLFMDGPFLVRGTKFDQDRMRMDFIKNQLEGDNILFSADCEISKFSKSMLIGADKVITEVDIRKWDANELDKLRISVRNISKKLNLQF